MKTCRFVQELAKLKEVPILSADNLTYTLCEISIPVHDLGKINIAPMTDRQRYVFGVYKNFTCVVSFVIPAKYPSEKPKFVCEKNWILSNIPTYLKLENMCKKWNQDTYIADALYLFTVTKPKTHVLKKFSSFPKFVK